VFDAIWLIPALPLAGFLVLVAFGRRLGEPRAGLFATAMLGGSFVVSVIAFFDMVTTTSFGTSSGHEARFHEVTIFEWLPVGDLDVSMAFLADPLSITMCLFVTGIGTLIHLYAVGYMHGDPKFSKFFIYLNLFAFSMLMLVLGENLLVTFLGWEGVGTCSYLLISFWHTRESAATAGKKAFVTNRVGDWGFMVAMFLAFQAAGTLSYHGLNEVAGAIPQSTATAIAVMLFIGAVGKSAQLPLYFWLPDAMEGPTPVSALIHAATMVTAGVFLMVRMNPMLAAADDWVPTLIAWIGAGTALFAASVAVAQNDIKRVLAYSTVSQLGYMFLAVGSGAYVAAIFHMVTHAFFKALLFLGSGSVIHGMHDEQDMRRMGMLRALMPITAGTFIIGWLAIAGVPPFAGFWSKDEILLFSLDKSPVLYLLGLVTALLTAYYMTRQVIMVFFGEARWNDAADEHGVHGDFKPHESPPVMLLPLVALAGLSIVGGIVQLPGVAWLPHSITHKLEDWLHPLVEGAERELPGNWDSGIKTVLMLVAAAVAIAGIVGAYLVYQKKRLKAVEPAILEQAWRYDRLVSDFMGGPGREAFQATAWFDANVVDGAVKGSGETVRATAGVFRKAQSGFVRMYAGIIGLGVAALLAWFVLWRGVR
jgi:NADH-quinone oxidoreductase subunit L